MIKVLWFIAICLLLSGGIYFSIKLKFPQLHIISLVKTFINVVKRDKSALKSITVSLSARIGVGSLAGIALAIYYGGPGSIFWIWIIGVVTSINTYVESFLGVKYQEIHNNNYYGGPSYYIKKGLNNKKLAKLYAILVIITYIGGFITIQSNTISISVNNTFNINIKIIGLLLMIITLISISKGIRSISKITNVLIPIMGLIYIGLSFYIIVKNYMIVPNILKTIVLEAFNIRCIKCGFLSTIIIGVQRGIFSTESGLGTSSIAISTTNPNNKKNYSLIQILGIYFTIFIVCTSTALIILTSDYLTQNIVVLNGIELTSYSLNYHLGHIGSFVLITLVIFLAYSTIIAGYYYGESSMLFLRNKKRNFTLLKIFTVLLVFLGTIISPNILWNMVDIFIALIAIVNMYTIFKMRKEIVFDYKHKKM